MLAFKTKLSMTRGIFPNQITRIVNAKEFLFLLKNHKDSIVKTKAVLPQIGSPGFVKFKVIYKAHK